MNTEDNWLVQLKKQNKTHRLEANKLIQYFIDGLNNFWELKLCFNDLCWRSIMIWSFAICIMGDFVEHSFIAFLNFANLTPQCSFQLFIANIGEIRQNSDYFNKLMQAVKQVFVSTSINTMLTSVDLCDAIWHSFIKIKSEGNEVEEVRDHNISS